MAEHTYQFGRISVYGANINDKFTFIFDALEANVFITKRQFRYIITDERAIDFRDEKYLYGVLTKYRLVQENPVVDEEEKKLSTDETEKQVVASAKFFIHVDSQVIAYRPITKKISANQFRSSFSELVAEAHNRFFVQAPVDSIDEEIEIRESLGLFKRITKVISKIRPSNPGFNPIWKTVDDDMKTLGIEKEQVISESKKGIDPNALQSDERYKRIHMSIDGYGQAWIHGVREDGSPLVVSTENSPVTHKVIDYDEPVKVLEQLYSKFVSIRERTRHE